MWRWMKKNRWLALGLVAVMLFTLLPTNLNWADIAIGEPERASSETRPTEEGRSEEITTEAVTSEVVTSSETTETVTETAASTTEAVTVQGTTAADMGEATETITEASTTELAANGEAAGSTTEANTSSSAKTSTAVKKTSGKSGEKVSSSAKPEVSKANGKQYDLYVDDSTITVNDKELTNDSNVKNGDNIVVEVQFHMSNSVDQRDPSDEYIYDLKDAEGIDFSDVPEGNVVSEGRIVGTYRIEDGKLIIQITDETELNKSDLKGNVELRGKVNIDEGDLSDDRKGKVSFADKTYTVTVEEPDPNASSVSVSKARGNKSVTPDGIYQEYTITIQSTGDNTDINLNDIAGENLSLEGEVTVESSPTGTSVEITKKGNSFECHIDKMEDEDKVTLTYRMKIDSKAYASDSDYTTYQNKAEYDYTDSEGKEPPVWWYPETTADVSKPNVSKSGTYDSKSNRVKWTITVRGGDLDLNGSTLSDVLGEHLAALASSDNILVELTYEDWSKDNIQITAGMLFGSGAKIQDASGKKITSYTLTYETEVENFTSSMEETYATNEAIAIVNGQEYTDEAQVGIGKKDLVDKQCTTSKDSLEKETNPDNQLLQWETTIHVPAGGLNGLKYTDTIGSGHELVKGSIKVTYAGRTIDYTSSEEGNSFVLDFGNVDNAGPGDQDITITYTTKCTNITDTLMEYTYHNNATVKVVDNDKEITQTDNASYSYEKGNILTKAANQWLNNLPEKQPGEIDWFLTVDVSTYNATSDLVITDTLPEGMILKDSSIRSDYTNSGNYNAYDTSNVTASGTENVITIKIPQAYINAAKSGSGKISIFYTSQCKNIDALLKYSGAHVTNQAVVKDGDEIVGSASAGVWMPQQDKLVDKSVEYTELTAPYVNYRIDINKNSLDLLPDGDKVTVIDEMGNVLSLDPSTFVIYESDGVTPLSKDQYTLNYETNVLGSDGNPKNRITVEIPDNRHLIIEYKAKLNLKTGTNLWDKDTTNTVRLEGFTSSQSQSSQEVNGTVFKSAAELTSTTGSLTLYKYSDNIGRLLADAEFTVYMINYDETTQEITTVEPNKVYGYTGPKSITTGKKGPTVIDGLIYDHIYVIQETKAPAGYQLDNTKYFFMIASEATMPTSLPGNDDYKLLNLDGNIAYVENEPAKDGYFNIGKKTPIASGSGKMTYLAGAQLALYAEDSTEPVLTFETGDTTTSITVKESPEPGKMEIKPGKYRLVEEKAPDGYYKATDIVFSVDINGKVTDESGNSISEVEMVDYPVTVKIAKRKFLVSGDRLPGAELSLYRGTNPDSDAVPVKVINTTTDSDIEITGLIVGETYTLRETETPAGYETAEDIVFTIKENGEVDGASPYVNASGNIVTMVDQAEKYDMYISKVAFGGTGELSGATLAVYPEGDSTEVDTWVSNSITGPHKITISEDAVKPALKPGKYVLKEKEAPQGYIYSKDIHFEVTKDGKVLVDNEEQTDNTIVMTDAPYSIYIDKRDISDDKPLNGATFTLTKQGESVPVDSWTFDGKTKHEIKGENLVIGATYTLTETKAPDAKTVGGQSVTFKPMNPVDFKVLEDGSIEIISSGRLGDDVALESSGETAHNQIILYNKAISPGNFVISKQEPDVPGEITGVHFQLYQADMSGNATGDPIEWDTGSIPKTFWVFDSQFTYNAFDSDYKLMTGTYILKETSAPFGYVQSTSTWTIKVDLETVTGEGGFVTLTVTGMSGTEGKVIDREPSGTHKSQDLQVYNTMKTLEISKKAVGGTEEVPGATLQVLKKNAVGAYELVPGLEWVSGDAPKSIRLEDLGLKTGEDGDFKLVETAAPDGYAYTKDIEFHVSKDGKVSAVSGVVDSVDCTDNDTTATLVMRDAGLSLKIQKFDDANVSLEGAEFCILDSGNNVIEKWTSDNSAHEITSALKAGATYTLRETKAPAGYAKAEDVKFTIQENGDIALASGSSSATIDTADSKLIRLTDKLLALTIQKKNKAGGDLSGAKFSIYETGEGAASNAVCTVSITATNGLYSLTPDEIKKLSVGKRYLLVETEAPSGYAQAQPVTFEIKDDGTIAIVEDNGVATVFGNTITVIDEEVGIQFLKRSTNGNAIVPNAYLRLESLTDPNFKAEEWKTTNVPYNVPGIKFTPGKQYRLTELVAPNGYAYTEPVVFTYRSGGKVQLDNQPDNASVSTTNTVQLSLYDEELNIYISKTDIINDSAEIPGAQMVIKDLNGTVIDSWTSGRYPHRVDIRKLVAGKDYTLEETTAPKGYKVTTVVQFTVEQDGTITASDTNVVMSSYNTSASSGYNWLKLKDEPLELKINKVDENGNALSGATLQLLDAEGTEIDSWVSDGNAHEVKAALLTGGQDYTLKELAPPSNEYGYSDDITITIEPDGTIKQDGKVVTDCTVTMVDYEIGVLINKEDMGGKTLPGATLQITSEQDTEFAGTKWSAPWVSGEHPRNIPRGVLKPDTEYVLTETTAPDGYACAESITFKIDEYGNVYVKSGDAFEPVTGSTVTMKDKPLELYIRKFIKGTTTMLAGAKFAIVDKDTKEEVYTFTSGEQAVTVPNTALKAGTSEGRKEFILTEKEAPEGYALAPDIEFAIDRDGSVWMKGADGAYTQAENYTLNVYDEKDSLMISKQNFGGEELAGSTIIITSEEDPAFVPISFVSTNTKTLIKLDTFKRNVHYILTEIGAPAGYAYADSIIFTLDEAGNVYVNGTMVSDNTLVIKDGAIDLKVAKKIDGKDKYLSKAKLAIIDETSGDTVYSWKTKKKATQIPGEKVKASTDTEKFIYILRETKAPKGYEKAKDIRFYIDKYGNIYTINKKGKETLVSDHIIVMNDKKSDEETDTKTATKTDSKKTGDPAPIALAGILFSLSLAGAGTAYGLRRKKARKK